jgi:hypothetical protein
MGDSYVAKRWIAGVEVERAEPMICLFCIKYLGQFSIPVVSQVEFLKIFKGIDG